MLEEVLGMQVWAINHKFKEGLPTLFLHWLYAHEVERIVKCVIKLTELMHVYRFSWQKTCLAKKVLKLIWCIFCTSAWFLLGRASTKNYLEHNLFTVHRKIQVCSQIQKDRIIWKVVQRLIFKMSWYVLKTLFLDCLLSNVCIPLIESACGSALPAKI